jgi:hypothetical protein
LWTGNDTSQTITNSGGFQPDFVWIKQRTSTNFHQLNDAVRGNTKYLYSNNTEAEETVTTRITSYNSNGFSIGSSVAVNNLDSSFVGWQWKANGGTGVTNTAGTITSTVSANTSAGFSVVTFTSQSSGTSTIGHGLGVAPKFIITKQRTAATGWGCYHASTGNSGYLTLNSTAAFATDSNQWNNTSPTSSVFTLGANYAGSVSTLAYCFSEVAGYSKFGSYTGNGSSDGTFVYLGFKPKYVMIKNTNRSDSNWLIYDTARDTFNASGRFLGANTSSAENDDRPILDMVSNGFKIRNSFVSGNASGNTIIYAAFAEFPTKYSLAV